MTLRERLRPDGWRLDWRKLDWRRLASLKPPPRLIRPMKIAAGALGALVGLFVLAVLIIPNLIPQEVYRAEIEKAVRAATGREVSLTGAIRVSVFPRIEAQAGPASISNPGPSGPEAASGPFGEEPFASMKELRAAISLWPLLFGGRIEVEEFVAVAPDIRLIILPDGANNWTFTPAADPAASPESGGQPEGRVQDLRIEDGQVSLENRSTGRTDRLSGLSLRAEMEAMDRPLALSASGLANDRRFDLSARLGNPKAALAGKPSPLRLDLEADLISAEAEGQLALGERPVFDLTGRGQIPSLSELAAVVGLGDSPIRPLLGRLTFEGQAFGDIASFTLKLASARHDSDLITASLRGEAQIADGRMGLLLDAQAEAPRLGALARAMAISAPAEAALGKATFSARLSGAPDDLVFENVRFSHDSGLLGLSFTGRASLREALVYEGRLKIAAPDLRGLAEAAGAPLPPGTVYRSFFLEGDTSGGTGDVLLSNASLSFDDIRARGEAGLRFGETPRLIGALSLPQSIDITPYGIAAGAPARAETGLAWPDSPIDLSPLKLADADLRLEAAGVRFGLFDFGESRINLSLDNGRLRADLEETTLFGGKGRAQLLADGGGGRPAVQLSASISGLSLRPLLKAAAGFDALEGAGDLVIDIGGSGGDLKSLMGSLIGAGSIRVRDGVLRGLDLTALGDAARSALGTREIRGGAISPLAQTRFRTLETGFAMSGGLAVVDGFTLNAPAFSLTGAGALDIGRREAQLSLFPQYVNPASGLNGYGLPLKFSGAWNGIQVKPDWDWLADKASAALTARARTAIDEEVRAITGRLGARLGLGLPPAAPSAPSAPVGTPAGAPAGTPAGAPEGTPSRADESQARPEPPASAAPEGPPQSPGGADTPAPSPEDRLRSEAEKALRRVLGGD